MLNVLHSIHEVSLIKGISTISLVSKEDRVHLARQLDLIRVTYALILDALDFIPFLPFNDGLHGDLEVRPPHDLGKRLYRWLGELPIHLLNRVQMVERGAPLIGLLGNVRVLGLQVKPLRLLS